MSKENKGQVLIYRTPKGKTEIEVNIDGTTVWLTQKQISELFQVTVPTINEHIKNIIQSKEVEPNSTIRKSRIVQKEGNRNVTRDVEEYNLDVIISVGYRVNSIQGTHFRIWATQQLTQYLIKGFVLDDAKLKGEKSSYFDELYQRVREIRNSEKNLSQKIKDIFALTSLDYEPNAEIAKKFFSSVQNMFHYAVHGHTASELIKERADGYKDHSGLYTWKGEEITKQDVVIAKNYLDELEIKRLNLLSDQFLSFAELQSIEKRPMYMATWISKLIDFLKLNDKPVLTDAGRVSAEVGKQIALREFDKFSSRIIEETKELKSTLATVEISEPDYEKLSLKTDELVDKSSFGNILHAVTKAGKPKDKDEK